MMEWKILQGNKEDLQKTLNQWKHQYIIHIHAMTPQGVNNITILLTRKRIK